MIERGVQNLDHAGVVDFPKQLHFCTEAVDSTPIRCPVVQDLDRRLRWIVGLAAVQSDASVDGTRTSRSQPFLKSPSAPGERNLLPDSRIILFGFNKKMGVIRRLNQAQDVLMKQMIITTRITEKQASLFARLGHRTIKEHAKPGASQFRAGMSWFFHEGELETGSRDDEQRSVPLGSRGHQITIHRSRVRG